MIDLNNFLSAIKTRLDADSTLKNANHLVVKGEGSKVKIGNLAPGNMAEPFLTLYVATFSQEPYTKMCWFTIGLSIYVSSLPGGEEDTDRLQAIAYRLHALLDDYQFTISGMIHHELHFDSQYPVFRDGDNPRRSFQTYHYYGSAVDNPTGGE